MSSAGPIHSAASITPRWAAGTISPPGRATAVMPISLKISPVIPGGARYFSFLKSATLVIGRLNQPSGSGPMGWMKSGSTLTLSTSV